MMALLFAFFADRARRMAYCVLPVLLGAGAALMVLLAASGPAWARTANQPLGLGCGATIQACIDAASPGDTILISAGDYTESLTLGKAVSLTGALSSTTILHALPNTRVLTVTGAAVDSSVIISGLTFAGGHAVGGSCPDGCGGAILITATAQPLLINLTISNSLADLNGGGLYADTGSPLVMSGAAVLSNTSSGNGGGAFAQGNATLNWGLFLNNQCTGSCIGGGLYTLSTLTLNGTQFINNTSRSGGGGAYSSGTTLNGGLFQGNVCVNDYCEGGGLWTGTLVLSATQFLSNTSQSNGGGAMAGVATLIGGLFQGNQCKQENFNCYGGGLWADKPALTATMFISNASLAGGGGLYGGGGAILTGAQFVSNSAFSAIHNSFGGGLYVYGTVTLTASSFLSDTAGMGGGLYAVNDVSVIDSSFFSNAATAAEGEAFGGGLFAGGTAWLTGTQFVSNTAGEGGGLYGFGPVLLTGSQFVSNKAYQGGGLFASGT